MTSFILIQVTSMVPWLEKCPVSSYQHLYCYLGQNVVPEPWYEWQLQGVPVLGIYRMKFPLPIHKPARVDALKLAFQYLFLCLLGSLVKKKKVWHVLGDSFVWNAFADARLSFQCASCFQSAPEFYLWGSLYYFISGLKHLSIIHQTGPSLPCLLHCSRCLPYSIPVCSLHWVYAHNSIRNHN